MRTPGVLRGNPRRVFLGTVACAALALTGGGAVSGSSTWQVGDLVVCVGSGQCRIYSSPTNFQTISVPQNPKKETGEPAWSSAFALYVIDARNQKVHLFSKSTPHSILQTIDTAAVSSTGLPGPLVVDSAGSLYVGMTNLGVILKYNRAGVFQQQLNVGTEAAGGVDWLALADDHRHLYFTSSGHSLQRVNLADGSSDAWTLSTDGVAAGLRILPVPQSLDPDDDPVVDGSSGILVADGVNIKKVSVAEGQTEANVLNTYDAPGENAWRAVTLHPDGRRFLAATGGGKVYTFSLESSSPLSDPVIDTGSASISGLSVKGGNQLNIRAVNFGSTVAADARGVAVFGNPDKTPEMNEPWPRHAFGVLIPEAVNTGTDVVIVVSANWAAGDGLCTGSGDYDCRSTPVDPGARCIPYVSGSETDCVFYRVEDEAVTIPSTVEAHNLLKFIDFRTPANAYTPDACTGDPLKGNPRMLYDPASGQPFTADITIGTIQTASDPILGRGTGGSDYGAFDRCIEQQGTIATILIPADNSTAQAGRSVPIEFTVTRNGQDVANAVTPPNNVSLLILNNGTGEFFLEPQPTPGGSPAFFTATTIKLSKNQTQTVYRGNWDTSGFPLGLYTLTITSIDNELQGPGLFAPVSVSVTLR